MKWLVEGCRWQLIATSSVSLSVCPATAGPARHPYGTHSVLQCRQFEPQRDQATRQHRNSAAASSVRYPRSPATSTCARLKACYHSNICPHTTHHDIRKRLTRQVATYRDRTRHPCRSTPYPSKRLSGITRTLDFRARFEHFSAIARADTSIASRPRRHSATNST